MVIEEKTLSPTETMLFFTSPLPIQGTFLHTQTTPENLPIINNIAELKSEKTLLLTSDFMYIESISPSVMENLKTIALAEIDDFSTTPTHIQYSPQANLPEKIKLILKTIVAPLLQKDGGDIEFVSYDKGIVSVHFLGKCHGCPYAEKTLKNRVEKNLTHYLPEIREAVLV